MNIKTTLILLLVIGVLMAGVFLLPKQEDPHAPPAKEKLFPNLVASDVIRIDLVRPSQEATTLLLQDDGWRLRLGEARVRADAERVRDVLEPFESMSPRVTIGAASTAKRDEYGLSPEKRLMVRLHTKSEETHVLLLGVTAPQGMGSIYACAGVNGPVVVISEAVRGAALRTAVELRDRTPVEVHPLQVSTLAVRDADGNGFRGSFDADEQVWRITRLAGDDERPLGLGNSETVELLRGFASELEVADDKGFVADAPTEEELVAHGLSPAAHTIRLTTRNGLPERTLRIGKREGEGNTASFLWMVEGESSVYRSMARPDRGRGEGPVDEGLRDLLDAPLDRFRDRNLLRLDAYAKADELLLTEGERRIHLKKTVNVEGDEHWRFVEPDVKGWAQDDDVDAFVGMLKNLDVAAFADDTGLAQAGLGEDPTPTASLEVRMVGDETPRVFTIGAAVPDVGHYLRRGTEDLLVVSPSTLLEAIRRPWYRFRHREVRRISAATVIRIEAERGGVRETLVRDGDDWSVVDAGDAKPDEAAVMDVLVTFEPVQTVRHPTVGFVAMVEGEDDGTLEAYGLKSPAVVLRLTYRAEKEEKVISLRVGTAVDGRHHARTEGAGPIRDTLVFVLSDEAWEAVNRPLIADE